MIAELAAVMIQSADDCTPPADAAWFFAELGRQGKTMDLSQIKDIDSKRFAVHAYELGATGMSPEEVFNTVLENCLAQKPDNI